MLLLKIGGEAYGGVRAGHARPLPGGEKGRVSGRGKVRRRGQDPSLRMEASMAADAKRAGSLKKAGIGANIAMMLLN